MDLARAEADLNNLIERRARQHDEAHFEEMAWKESVRKHNAKLRRQHRAEWFAFYSRLGESLRASAAHYDRKAAALLLEEEGGG